MNQNSLQWDCHVVEKPEERLATQSNNNIISCELNNVSVVAGRWSAKLSVYTFF